MQTLRFIIVVLAVAGDISAHGSLHEQLTALTAKIGQQPGNPEVFLRRGELHYRHGNWSAALADYDSAAKLAPNMADIDFRRARVWLDCGDPAQALTLIDTFLSRHPNQPEALIVRAEAQGRTGNWVSAALDNQQAISASNNHSVELYIATSNAWDRAEAPLLALKSLEKGIEHLGSIPVLQLAAIDLERKVGRWESALARIDSLSSNDTRKETWLWRRGQILHESGHCKDATVAFQQALDAIQSLPAVQRHTKAVTTLQQQLRVAIEVPCSSEADLE